MNERENYSLDYYRMKQTDWFIFTSTVNQIPYLHANSDKFPNAESCVIVLVHTYGSKDEK